jgi:hypothetical protein
MTKKLSPLSSIQAGRQQRDREAVNRCRTMPSRNLADGCIKLFRTSYGVVTRGDVVTSTARNGGGSSNEPYEEREKSLNVAPKRSASRVPRARFNGLIWRLVTRATPEIHGNRTPELLHSVVAHSTLRSPSRTITMSAHSGKRTLLHLHQLTLRLQSGGRRPQKLQHTPNVSVPDARCRIGTSERTVVRRAVSAVHFVVIVIPAESTDSLRIVLTRLKGYSI